MAILGLGTDLVEIARIKAQVARVGEKLALRVLTPTELCEYRQHKQPERFLAKRFAAKEAAAKALGTGIGRGVSFQHIQISNNEWGAPQLSFTAGALDRFNLLKGSIVHLSITDEVHYASATVILES